MYSFVKRITKDEKFVKLWRIFQNLFFFQDWEMASNELDSFISGLDDQDKSEVVANPKQETDKGQYFVDQTTGQYYYQSENNESIAVAGLPEETTEVTSNNTNNDSNNQVVLNTGGDQYQTVTIVPSDGNTGEVSYVLIVQQPEDKDKQSEEAIGNIQL